MKTSRILKIATFVLFGLSLAMAVTYTVLALTGFFKERYTLDMVLSYTGMVIYILTALVFTNYMTNRNVIKKLVDENTFYLGFKSNFYNYYLFSRRVRNLNFLTNKEEEAYIIAFTPMKISVTTASNKNDVVIDYLGKLSNEIDNAFRKENPKLFKKLSFCFHHGVFILLIYKDIEYVNKTVERLENIMYDIAENNRLNVYVTPYFGISKFSRDTKALLGDTENAIYARNEAEKFYKTVEYFDPKTIKKTDINDVKELEDALKNQEFIVYYQPKFSLTTNEFVSSEALIRWNSSVRGGLVSPVKFIEIAEEGGLIHEVDMYVFKRVCEDLSDTRKRGRRLLPVSVNFAMQEFFDDGFVDDLVKICEDAKIPTKYLYIEITERTSAVNTFMTVNIVKQLKEKGFKVLMDDFGTGYSNFENLMTIPFDAIKADRSYIKNIENDTKSAELVRLIINFCKANGILFVAEGADSQAQIDLLRKFHGDIVQGFYYSKPLPKEEYMKFLLPGGNPFEKKRRSEKE